jgi:hypothetical protein
VDGGVLFNGNANNTKLLAFGGIPGTNFVNDTQDLWYFDANSEEWTLEPGKNLPQLSSGAATNDPNQNIGYYLGGAVDNAPQGPFTVASNGLLAFNLSDFSWKTEKVLGSLTNGGFLEYVPASTDGILVAFGGQGYDADSSNSTGQWVSASPCLYQ